MPRKPVRILGGGERSFLCLQLLLNLDMQAEASRSDILESDVFWFDQFRDDTGRHKPVGAN